MNGVEYKGNCCGGNSDAETESNAIEVRDMSASGPIVASVMTILALLR